MVGRFEKLLSFYLGYTGQESDFPKMAIQTLGEALQIKVGRVSTNTGIFILALIHVLKYLIICQKKQIQVHRKYLFDRCHTKAHVSFFPHYLHTFCYFVL